jgi:tripartite-type tricarboxylate transporter receptor subunit TctC
MTRASIAATRRVLLLGATAAALARPALAQADWPNRPVRIVIPFMPGGPMEPINRILADWLTRSLGQPFVLDNRPGATGTVGAAMVARSAPDGYTLLLSANTGMVVAPLVLKSAGYDALRDFAPIALLQTYPLYLVVNPALPIRDVPGFIAYLKANPGKANYTSPGTGSGGHLATAMLMKLAGTEAQHISFGGTVAGLLAIVRGDAHFALDSVGNAQPLVDEGKLRGVAVTGPRRNPRVPTLPTLIESGFPDFQTEIWMGLFAPAGLPPGILRRISEATEQCLADSDVRARLTALTFTPGGGGPEALAARIRDETPRWAEAVRITGVHVD